MKFNDNFSVVPKLKRDTSVGYVHRKLTGSIRISTLFGVQFVLKRCTCCKQVHPVTNYYLKWPGSGSEELRSHCIPCWDKYNGVNPNIGKCEEREEMFTSDLTAFL